jgi:prophage DNA circulation protein
MTLDDMVKALDAAQATEGVRPRTAYEREMDANCNKWQKVCDRARQVAYEAEQQAATQKRVLRKALREAQTLVEQRNARIVFLLEHIELLKNEVKQKASATAQSADRAKGITTWLDSVSTINRSVAQAISEEIHFVSTK